MTDTEHGMNKPKCDRD